MNVAQAANASSKWGRVWMTPELRDWRGQALSLIYDRVAQLCPEGSSVVDLGGGVGVLGEQLRLDRGCRVTVVEHNTPALAQAAERGLGVHLSDIERGDDWPTASVLVATEVLEHFTQETRARIYEGVGEGSGLFSVPHNRLGPDEEPEHTRKWTAKEFLDELRGYFGAAARVECIGEYLLGVVGSIAIKPYTMSVCMPVRDEAADLRVTLASFRGCADQLVVGVDHRTTDDTRAVAAEFADLVFDIDDPTGPAQDGVPEAGVHFAHVRNRCMDRCTGDWIFMTEGHERLGKGEDTLLRLHEVMPEHARVGYVYRSGNNQRWAFPWLCRNAPDLRYKRATHNVLDYPSGTFSVKLPQVLTIHERVPEKDVIRREQRKRQNRTTLMRDWLNTGNENSFHYLGAEWREHCPDKAIEMLRRAIIEARRNGPRCYHTRLILAKSLIVRDGDGDQAEARDVLMGCAAEDWNRTDHWMWLGDLAFDAGRYEEALQFFLYASTAIGRAPFTMWWVDLANYSWAPAMRLAMTYGALGDGHNALSWARRVVELLPDDQQDAAEEARQNVQQLEEALHEHAA